MNENKGTWGIYENKSGRRNREIEISEIISH